MAIKLRKAWLLRNGIITAGWGFSVYLSGGKKEEPKWFFCEDKDNPTHLIEEGDDGTIFFDKSDAKDAQIDDLHYKIKHYAKKAEMYTEKLELTKLELANLDA